MEMEIEYQALIDKFLRNEAFSETEQKKWDQWQDQEAFAELLAYNHDLMVALKQKGREALKKELSDLQNLHQKAEGNIRSMRLIWAGVAVAAAICLIYLILPLQSNVSPTELYASHYERFPNVANPITRDSGAQSSLKDRAYARYEQGDYENAIILFDSLLLEEPSLTHQFYQGISAMEKNDWSLAQKKLNPVAKSDTSRFAQAAQWYVALIGLHSDSIEGVKITLETIKNNPSHPYTKEASELLEKL